jgi:Zn-finger nucleic acid-binding protein
LSGATILVAYLPADKIICETNMEKHRNLQWKLFHDCMAELLELLVEASKTGVEAICGDGQVCHIYPFVTLYIADNPQQCKVANIKRTYCPVCKVAWDKKGELDTNVPLQKHQETMAIIKEHKNNGSAKFEALVLQDTKPFWMKLPYIDLATIHMPDLLHQLHWGVFKDHLAKWISNLKGDSVVDE